MTPEERALLQRIAATVDENNSILRSLRRMNRISFIWRVTYWVVIIGISVGALYFIQPYLEAVTGTIDTVQDNIQGAQDILQDLQGVGDLLK